MYGPGMLRGFRFASGSLEYVPGLGTTRCGKLSCSFAAVPDIPSCRGLVAVAESLPLLLSPRPARATKDGDNTAASRGRRARTGKLVGLPGCHGQPRRHLSIRVIAGRPPSVDIGLACLVKRGSQTVVVVSLAPTEARRRASAPGDGGQDPYRGPGPPGPNAQRVAGDADAGIFFSYLRLRGTRTTCRSFVYCSILIHPPSSEERSGKGPRTCGT